MSKRHVGVNILHWHHEPEINIFLGTIDSPHLAITDDIVAALSLLAKGRNGGSSVSASGETRGSYFSPRYSRARSGRRRRRRSDGSPGIVVRQSRFTGTGCDQRQSGRPVRPGTKEPGTQ